MARNVAAAVTMLLGMTAVVQAQEATLAELYGSGVHSYHAGEYKDAHKSLTKAIKKGSKDPRCYIFRGLAYLKLGRPEEAKTDFKQGAELELTKEGKLYRVSRALSRVQGKFRIQIESYRKQARKEARLKRVREVRARYGNLDKQEKSGRVLSPSIPNNAKVVVPPGTKKDPSNPFKGGTTPNGSEPTPTSAIAAGTNAADGASAAKAAGVTGAPAKISTPTTTAKAPAKTTNTNQAAAAKPKASESAVTRGFFNFFKKKTSSLTSGASGAIGKAVQNIPGLSGGASRGKPPSTGKKFKGDKNAPDPFGDDAKKK